MDQKNKEVILKYFNSWQQGNFKALRDSLDENVEFDMNGNSIIGADSFVEMCKNGVKWKKVKLLDSIFEENKASLVYDGITVKENFIRVSEILSIKDRVIVKSIATMVVKT